MLHETDHILRCIGSNNIEPCMLPFRANNLKGMVHRLTRQASPGLLQTPLLLFRLIAWKLYVLHVDYLEARTQRLSFGSMSDYSLTTGQFQGGCTCPSAEVLVIVCGLPFRVNYLRHNNLQSFQPPSQQQHDTLPLLSEVYKTLSRRKHVHRYFFWWRVPVVQNPETPEARSEYYSPSSNILSYRLTRP